jgi:hypothetical protein
MTKDAASDNSETSTVDQTLPARRPGSRAGVITTVILALLVAYFGSYSALVRPITEVRINGNLAIEETRPRYEYDESLPFVTRMQSRKFVRSVFGPANVVDRRVRPNFWTTRPPRQVVKVTPLGQSPLYLLAPYASETQVQK